MFKGNERLDLQGTWKVYFLKFSGYQKYLCVFEHGFLKSEHNLNGIACQNADNLLFTCIGIRLAIG